jgi:hypothetical protein
MPVAARYGAERDECEPAHRGQRARRQADRTLYQLAAPGEWGGQVLRPLLTVGEMDGQAGAITA